MQQSIEKSDGIKTITLKGELTISSAEALRELLLQELSDNEQIRLNLEQVTDIDLSCLQILCSAHRTSNRMKKSLTRTGMCPESLKNISERSGYSRHRGCKEHCLWVGMHENIRQG